MVGRGGFRIRVGRIAAGGVSRGGSLVRPAYGKARATAHSRTLASSDQGISALKFGIETN